MILYAITTKIFINTVQNIFKEEKKIYSYKLLEEKIYQCNLVDLLLIQVIG